MNTITYDPSHDVVVHFTNYWGNHVTPHLTFKEALNKDGLVFFATRLSGVLL